VAALSTNRREVAPSYRAAAIRIIGHVIGVIAAGSLIFMTLVTVTDVIGRYVFNSPLKGADELTVISLAVAVFSGLPLAIAHRGMITVGVLVVHLPSHFQWAAHTVADLASGTFMAFCGWQVLIKAEKLESYDDKSMFLQIPMAPIALMVAVASFLSAVVFIGLVFEPLLRRTNWLASTGTRI